jgi:hypothetical protein
MPLSIHHFLHLASKDQIWYTGSCIYFTNIYTTTSTNTWRSANDENVERLWDIVCIWIEREAALLC